MLTAISAYLFGEETDECLHANELSESEDIVDDWVFVNRGIVQGRKDDSKDQGETGKGNRMDESWYVTPPSCFNCHANKGKKVPPVHKLENLLIEHPSMSVYAPRPLKKDRLEQANGASPKETAVRPIVNSKAGVQGDNHQLRQSKIFLNQPVSKRVPLQELACNSRNSVAIALSYKGMKRSNQVHQRQMKGRHQKQQSRREGKHVGMVAKRST